MLTLVMVIENERTMYTYSIHNTSSNKNNRIVTRWCINCTKGVTMVHFFNTNNSRYSKNVKHNNITLTNIHD